MGDPACWLHLLDEEGRIPDPPAEEVEAGARAEAEQGAEQAVRQAAEPRSEQPAG